MSEGILSAPSIPSSSVPTPPSPLYTLFWDASNGNAPSVKAHTTGTVTAFGGFTTEQVQDIVGAMLDTGTETVVNFTYDDTGAVVTATLVANSVTDAMLVNMPTARFKGRTTAGTGVPENLTSAQATALLDLAVAMGVKGLVTGNDKKRIDVANMYYDIVADVGVDPTGVAPAAGLLQAWNDAISGSATRILYVPPDCKVKMDGNVNFTGNIRVIGGHRRTSRFETAAATGNAFTVSGDAVTFENVRFSTPTDTNTRTAGFAVSFTSASDSSGVKCCDFLFQWGAIQLQGSLQFVDDCNIREYNSTAAGGCCIEVSGSSTADRYIRRVVTDSTVPSAGGFSGIRVTLTSSCVLADCNIIHAGNALDLAPANAVTVPSVNAVNCFFDTSVVGLNCTGAGTVARSKFTHCWFGSMSDSGIKLGPTGTGTVEGLSFVNCELLNNVGGTTVGINVTTALVGKWKMVGGAIAGWTTGIALAGGTNHFPMISTNTIGGYGIFGNNTTGINAATGTYKGLVIDGNDMPDNTTPLTLGTITIGSGGYSRFRITENAGVNPRNTNVAPAVPASTVVATNTSGFPVTCTIKGGTITVITVGGIATTLTASATGFPIQLSPGETIAMTYSVAPTWTWVTQ